jgi:dephospho-CoA kinase
MRILGLTGGIGSGKSAVAGMIAEAGVPVVDADLIAREVVEPGTGAHAEIVSHFGDSILSPDGRIDRRKLGDIVFSDPVRRAELESITIPGIRAGIEAALGRLAAGGHPAAVVEAALLHENGRASSFEATICVYCDRETQRKRIVARDGISEGDAEKKIDAQMPSDEKARLSDYVIDNSGDIEGTKRQVASLLSRLKLPA